MKKGNLKIVCITIATLLIASSLVFGQDSNESKTLIKSIITINNETIVITKNDSELNITRYKNITPSYPFIKPFNITQPNITPLIHPIPQILPMISGSGFAINGNEYHVVQISAIGYKKIVIQDIRELLRQNKSLAEIREALLNQSTETIAFRGNLKFANEHCTLKILEANESHLDAEIIKRATGTTPQSIAGSITINIAEYEGALVGVGDLTINGQTYKVYLNLLPYRPLMEPLLRWSRYFPEE